MVKRAINVKVLPGEPLDGTGRVCIHLFVRDETGPFVEPCALDVQTVSSESGEPVKKLVSGPARGRLACDRSRTVAPVVRGNSTTITIRSDDPRAVTCPKCKASLDYARMMELQKTN